MIDNASATKRGLDEDARKMRVVMGSLKGKLKRCNKLSSFVHSGTAAIAVVRVKRLKTVKRMKDNHKIV
jgi:hypothetical protein